MRPSPTTFAEFWPYYMSQHQNALSRLLHYIGTSIAISALVAALVTMNAWLLIAMPVGGYGFAWFGHFVIQKNKPATFGNPFWSLAGDLKMLAYALTGRLGGELARLEKANWQPANLDAPRAA